MTLNSTDLEGKISIKVNGETRILAYGVDYTIDSSSYKNNNAAGTATDSYAAATANLAQNYALISNDIANVAEETRAYKQSVNEVGQKLASLNSVYELQLQAVNAQVEAQKHVAAATKEAADAQLAFANGAKQLQKQVTDLNGIYGNMLNALA